MRATPPVMDSSGNLKFDLYPVPVGSYTLVVTAPGYSSAIVTGVPSSANASTTINSVAFPILPPLSGTQTVTGTVSAGLGANNTVDTGGVVRALQLLSGGPTIEAASDNVDHDDGHYEMALPLGAPVKAPYVAGSVPLLFTPDAVVTGHYRLAATVARSTEVQFADVALGAAPVQKDFHFVAP